MSYSRDDVDWLLRFQMMLKPLVRKRHLQLWSDAQVIASRTWRPEISSAIERASAALLLVSPAFLGSDFIMEQELPELIKHDVALVPVLVRTCRFGDVDELSNIQWAHDPHRDGPLAKAADIDHEIVRVCDSLLRMMGDRDAASSAIRDQERRGPPTRRPGRPPALRNAGIERASARGQIFLCHSSTDKAQVRTLYQRLVADGFDPWLDENELRPGQPWQPAIEAAVRTSKFVVVCLSHASTTRAGYVHKEIRLALDVAEEQRVDSTFVIPVRLEDCNVPDRLSRIHWVDLFRRDGYQQLARVLGSDPWSVEAVTTDLDSGIEQLAVSVPVETRWYELGADSGFLGQRLTPVLPCDDGIGLRQRFQRGSIHWTAATGAWETHGAIGERWRMTGAENSFLGYPLSGELPCGGGDDRYQTFQRGWIHWTEQTGAWETHGAIGARWRELGAETGLLGYPLTGEVPCGTGEDRYQDFERGSIHWSATTGAWETHGAIGARWRQLGAESSALGYPLTGELASGAGDDRHQTFQRGSISWDAEADTTAVHSTSDA